jgi:hypothetical protein
VGITTAVAGAMNDLQISLYPNPASERTLVESNGDAIEQVLVYDMMGHLVLDLAPNATKAELNVSGLSRGNYIVKVKVNENVEVRRMEVIR